MASNSFGLPDNDPVTDENRRAMPSWAKWFSSVHRLAQAVQSNGTTANRPTSFLWPGRFYFDTTLNQPIWIKTVSPVVWIDATGASV